METNEYYLKINHEGKIILITGITSSAISIDFSGDVDFTRLVDELTRSIDKKVFLTPNDGNDTSDENSLKLILETIGSIIGEYNGVVTSLIEAGEIDSDAEIKDVDPLS